MYYYLAYFPKIDYSQINIIREKYDPNYSFVDPHIAVVFPLDSSIGEQELNDHIQEVIKSWKPFKISLAGLEKSWDHYLYLTVQQGKNEIALLHDNLYSGILSSFWLKEIQYKPHVTLGFFADKQAKFDKSDLGEVSFNEKDFNEAISLAKSLNINFQTTFNNVTLISREDKKSQAIIVKEFLFEDSLSKVGSRLFH
jgi:2'-5' RNA ligase